MLLNGAPLNSVPLNGGGGAAPQPPEPPEPIVRAVSYQWRLRLEVGGVDVTGQWTAGADADREEGAAGVGSFALYLPAADGPVTPTDWIGRAVQLTYVSTSAGTTVEERRYTGQVVSPTWDPRTRLMQCECSDQLQQRVEALPVSTVDSLTGGLWSVDVFEPVEGRSHWDYALERMSTRTASLDCSALGALRVTSWYATAPAFVFGPGTTLDDSLELELAPASGVTNRLEIDVSYRYSRLWQRNQSYSWQHPGTEGITGIGGFCLWRTFPSELPNKQMVEEAAAGNGETVLSPLWYELPGTMANPCGDGSPWINREEGLLLGATWTGARRWAQTITENYPVVMVATGGEDEATRIVQREGYTLDAEDEDRVAAWETDPITGGTSGSDDLGDAARRSAVFAIALNTGASTLVQAHRETTISWSVPTSMALGIDLSHTLEINDQNIHAIGKCRRIVDSFDPASGTAITTLSIAVMRGGGVSDPLVPPPVLGASTGGGSPGTGIGDDLPTQISSLGSPDYDPEIDGFSGNADGSVGPSVFPRDLVAPADEIAEIYRDESVLTGAVTYRVGIPNDLLEM